MNKYLFLDIDGVLNHDEWFESEHYKKYQEKELGITAEVLPSTSPANAAYRLEKLVEQWARIQEGV